MLNEADVALEKLYRTKNCFNISWEGNNELMLHSGVSTAVFW